MSALASHLMVEAGRARAAAEVAKANGHDPIAAIAPFVNYAMTRCGRDTGSIASDLLLTEAEVWNARARMDAYRRRA